MELRLERRWKKPSYTIGNLYIDGVFFSNTIEDTDRGLSQKLPITFNKNKKKAGVTAIPTGRYRVTLEVQSPRFSKKAQYAFCKGFLPRLVNVPAFDGVLIHIGNTARDTEGCILVGENKEVGKVLNSTATFRKLYEILKNAEDTIYITVE